MLRKKARRISGPSPVYASDSPVVSDDDGVDRPYGRESEDKRNNDDVQVANLLDVEFGGEESDSSSEEDINPVGDIPMRWYEGYDHIGYDREGNKIVAQNKPSALDLASDPHAWRKVYDEKNDRVIELTHDELKAIARMKAGRVPGQASGSPDEDDVVAWSGPVMIHPLSSGNEPKRRFLPSRHEARQVVRLVRALRAGRIRRPTEDDNKSEDAEYQYDVWEGYHPKDLAEMTKSERERDMMRLSAPKPPLPKHAESYNPPAEYLPTEDEASKWHSLPPKNRPSPYIPTKYSALRHVPRYERFVQERFERCLDLYLAVRIKRDQTQVDADDLLPKLPLPSDLRPFPTDVVATFEPLASRARSIDIHPKGLWLVAGCDDGRVRVLEAATGYCRATWDAAALVDTVDGARPPVIAVAWCPRERALVFAAVVGKTLIVVEAARALGVDAEESDIVLERAMGTNVNDTAQQSVMDCGIVWEERNMSETDGNGEKSDGEHKNNDGKSNKESRADENGENDDALRYDREVDSKMVVVRHGRLLRTVCWHRKGDYLACVGRDGNNATVAVHRLSHRITQVPFKKSSLVQTVQFHPTRPFFFVATMHHVRLYNLAVQQLVKVLRPGASWISSVDVHSSGDHVLVTSYDRRTCWFDLDLSVRPYQTIRNHAKAVRVAKFHPRLPLFADASDDASCHIFHSTVYDDLNKNPLIVPVRKLSRCSKVVDSLGVLDIAWHPRLPLLYTCGADGTVKLYADCSQG